MLLKFKNKDSREASAEALADMLRQSDERREYFLLGLRTLLQYLSEFVLDIKEIGSEEFKQRISGLSEVLATEKKIRKLRSRFEKDRKNIAAYAVRQKDYLFDREAELKNIIGLLSQAIVTLDTENRQYNEKLLAQSKRIEEITLLDDIRKLKQMLIQEIEHMRATVREKQSRDTSKLETLSKQVDVLNMELQRVRAESVTDGLTGIYNRKAFDRHLDEIIKKNAVSHSPFSMLMIDIDDFKKFNDTYGHLTGDRVLLAVANKCRQSIRSEDFFARYGGEEFVVLLPGASLENAVIKARHICKSIASARYFLEDAPGGGQTLSVTVSIGVSMYRKGDSDESVTTRADKALYAAKHAGKNCVVSENQVSDV